MQVDLRVLNDLGAPARCAITAVTIQGDGGARSINPVTPDLIVDSISTALSDPPGIGAVKVGLLGAAKVKVMFQPVTAGVGIGRRAAVAAGKFIPIRPEDQMRSLTEIVQECITQPL